MNYYEPYSDADYASNAAEPSDYERLCLALTYLYDLDEEGMNEY